MDVLRVSAKSHSTAVAGAIAGIVRERGKVELQAIGAAAVNQAVKAVTIARSYLAQDGLDIVTAPAFRSVYIEGAERTAVRFYVESRAYDVNVAPQSPWGRDLMEADGDGLDGAREPAVAVYDARKH